MATINSASVAANIQEVGAAAGMASHVTAKPIPHTSTGGHYKYSVRILSTAAQAANSRIFELRNPNATPIILTRLTLRALQVAAGTAQENSLDCFRCTSFTVLDTTNTVTPGSSVKRTTGMTAFPGGAQVRHLTVAGAAAGMTGGTMTKDANMFATLPFNVAAAISTSYQWGPLDCVDDVNGTHPFVFGQNEGFEIENRVLNVTSYGMAWFLDVSWADALAF